MTNGAVTFKKVGREDLCKEIGEQTWAYPGEES